MLLSWLWNSQSDKIKKKSCLIIGSSYKSMDRALYCKYGFCLGKPDFSEYALEVENIGVHDHLVEYLSVIKFQKMLKSCQEMYPPEKYEMEIVIVLTRQSFLSEKLREYIPRVGKVMFYFKEDLALLKETPLNDLSKEYFVEDSADHIEDDEEVRVWNDHKNFNNCDETMPLIHHSSIDEGKLGEEFGKLTLAK